MKKATKRTIWWLALAVGLAATLGSLGTLASPSPASAEIREITYDDPVGSGEGSTGERSGYARLRTTGSAMDKAQSSLSVDSETFRPRYMIRVIDIYGNLAWLINEMRHWSYEQL